MYLNLVLDFVPETVYRVARHFNKAKTTIPIIYVKVGRPAVALQTEQTALGLANVHMGLSTNTSSLAQKASDHYFQTHFPRFKGYFMGNEQGRVCFCH